MTEGFEQSTLNALRRSQEVAQRAADWHQANQRRLDELVENASEPARRVNAWLEAHQDQIAAVARRLQEFDRLLKDIEEQWDGAGLGYLVSPLDAGEHLFLSLHAEPGNSDELFAFLEAAMADNEFVDAVCSALDSAAVLSDVPRRHLQHGMRHIGQRDVFNAWPPLIIGLEGAFADVAIAEGLAVRVDNHVYLADQGGHALSKKDRERRETRKGPRP